MSLTYKENETILNFDYERNKLTFYTTRRGEKNNVEKRVGKENLEIEERVCDGDVVAWQILIDMKHIRNPYYASPVLNK